MPSSSFILPFSLSPDVDECETNPCSHGCLNTYGSFMCTCDEGFELASDGTTCNGKQGKRWLERRKIGDRKQDGPQFRDFRDRFRMRVACICMCELCVMCLPSSIPVLRSGRVQFLRLPLSAHVCEHARIILLRVSAWILCVWGWKELWRYQYIFI